MIPASTRPIRRHRPKPRLLGLVAAERERELIRYCAYCGVVCQGKACRAHRDLVQIDPGMGSIA